MPRALRPLPPFTRALTREPRARRVVGWCVRRITETWALAALLTLVPTASAQSDAGGETSRDGFRALVDTDPFATDDPIGASPEAADPGQLDPLAVESTGDLRSVALPGEDALVVERLPIVRGPVIEAAAGVREAEHRTHVELVAGLALVRVEMRFESSARHAAEVGYRLPVPAGAVPYALEVCALQGQGEPRCRVGTIDEGQARLSAYDAALVAMGPLAPDTRPIAVIERSEGALQLRAAPIPALAVGADAAAHRGVLTVRVGYAVPVPVHGGIARLTLPARGEDARIAAEVLTVTASDLVLPELDGVEVLPGDTFERRLAQGAVLVAHVPRTWTDRVEAWTTPCGAQRCTWVRAQGPRPERRPHDVILAIDASPSTAAGARGLLPEAARAVLSALPSGSRVRVVAFAARAQAVLDTWTDAASVEDDVLRRASELELGPATSFEALWSLLAPSVSRGAHVVWIGDGGITSAQESTRALERARERGVRLDIVSVADRRNARALIAAAALFGQPIANVHDEALMASREQRAALDERLAYLAAPEQGRRISVRGAGEERVLHRNAGGAAHFIARTRGQPVLRVGQERVTTVTPSSELSLAIVALGSEAQRLVAASAPETSLACSAEQRVLHGSTALARVTALPNQFALVERRSCVAPASGDAAGARTERRARERRAELPRVALLRAMHQRIMPPARECFRGDRRGRAAYSTQIELRITIADQEIIDVAVEGIIDPTLRACMVRAVEHLEVPPFDGVILARWPLYSRPELAPPTLELHPDLATVVDAIGREPTPTDAP